jgi:hypothetical protein
VGTMPHGQIMHSIELLGSVVAPAVRKALGVAAPAVEPEPAVAAEAPEATGAQAR